MEAVGNNKRAIVTVVTRNYAHFAQVLLRSCRQFHPEADLFVLYVDRPPTHWREQTPGVHVLYADELAIPDWKRFSFQYTPFELSTSLKPFALERLQQLGYEKIVYLDGDMQIYGAMRDVFDALDSASIILTPHLLKPLPVDGMEPKEATYLNSGAFNGGFVAVRCDASSRQFTAWWKEMHRKLCIVDFASSLFVDQTWLSLVPGLFEGVHVLRQPGYNTGHWSFSQFEFTELPRSDITTSGIAIDGKPLVLLHFSGLTSSKPNGTLGGSLRRSLAMIPSLERLVDQFNLELGTAGMNECVRWGSEFANMVDGTPIQPAWREAVRRGHKWVAHFEDPFDNVAHPEILHRFRGLETDAYRWRRDWQLQWSKQQGALGKAKATGKRIEGMVRGLLRRKRAA